MGFILETTVVFLIISGVELIPIDLNDKEEGRISENQQTKHACYNKIVGFKGYFRSPHLSGRAITCEWNIDVTKGFVVEFEFEIFRLPINPERACDSYIEISYGSQSDPVKRMFCSADEVYKVFTDSQTALVRYHSGTYIKKDDHFQYGFKINYSAVPVLVKSSSIGSYAVTILLLTMAFMFIIALCIFCFRCRHKGYRNRGIPSHMSVEEEPNAPSREQLQAAFEIQRRAIQVPEKEHKTLDFPIFQSRTSSFHSSLSRWASIPHLPTAASASEPVAYNPERRQMSYATTPRSVFPELRKKWSDNSAQKIDHLRTKLVARFSSVSSQNTSDISVFFPATSQDTERGVYSQLSCDEDKDLDSPAEDETKQMSYAAAAKSVSPDTLRKWRISEKVSQLRTKLVNRFSSASLQSTSDISEFSSASNQNSEKGASSLLSCKEKKGLNNPV